ncbi:MAG TPA: class I SAM-dependent methyltransferase [Devosia sp.]|jgi:tRNA (cmo5U34)-methyltransferase|uniref:class I SAM-dependent methyltransferase n=1 Tax=Devosia sp. TaxID=1871048 RepID=UPI002DDC99DA|nr:class I SAM-dependent methyltransferase [Devosia sp.]HEV2514193.1 class I SAM-dependent methyltransferase [Devosia sp.]
MKNTFAGHGRGYLDGPPRQVPGFASLHRMIEMLLAERVPPEGRVLVLGAGGGMELKALADAQPGWTFDGVDPSADMLALAAETVGSHADRVHLHQGGIEAAPKGQFDGATCLLVFHFIDRAERARILSGLRQRLRPGAPLLLMHISFPQTEPERSQWIARHAAYGAPSGTNPTLLAAAREAIGTRLTILSPDEDEAMLADAGFEQISLFFAGMSFRGWVGHAV